MKKTGQIITYNGKYGTIISENKVIDFCKKDISFNQNLTVGDVVEFRIEYKENNILIAKNVNKMRIN